MISTATRLRKQVVADYQTFAQLVRSKIPATQFAFIAIKPSIKRWHLWPEMKPANEMIHDPVTGP